MRSSWEPLVVKADGLAAGKGVIVADDRDEAVQAAQRLIKVALAIMTPAPA